MDVKSGSEANPSYHLQYLCGDEQHLFCKRQKAFCTHRGIKELPCAVLPANSNARDVNVADTHLVSPQPESKDETSPQSFLLQLNQV